MVTTRRSAAAAAAGTSPDDYPPTPSRRTPTTPKKTGGRAAAASSSSPSSSPAAAARALAAGAVGAVAAAIGKLSGSACPSLFPADQAKGGIPLPLLPEWLTPLLACRSGLLALLLAANVAAAALFLRALASGLPSLRATVLSNAANLAATGALGALLFAEPITARWLCGVATVGAGLALISRSAEQPPAPRRARGGGGARAAAATPARQPRQRRSD
jgi:drug/metabolite transporter (DMT)-like permease